MRRVRAGSCAVFAQARAPCSRRLVRRVREGSCAVRVSGSTRGGPRTPAGRSRGSRPNDAAANGGLRAAGARVRGLRGDSCDPHQHIRVRRVDGERSHTTTDGEGAPAAGADAVPKRLCIEASGLGHDNAKFGLIGPAQRVTRFHLF